VAICLEVSGQLLVKNYGATDDKVAPKNNGGMVNGVLVILLGMICTVFHSFFWRWRIITGKWGWGAGADSFQLLLAMVFLLPALHVFQLTGDVLPPLKFGLWAVSLFLLQLIYLTIPFAKRGNTNRVFAVVVQAIQLFYISYLLNDYFSFTSESKNT
jgi:hypothetical protein